MNINDFNTRLETLRDEYNKAGFDKSFEETEITELVKEAVLSHLPQDSQIDLLLRVRSSFPESERITDTVSQLASTHFSPESYERRQILQAVKVDGMALQNAPEKYKDDREIVEAALLNDLSVWDVPDLLKQDMKTVLGSDPEFMEKMMDRWGGELLLAAVDELKSEGYFLLKALERPLSNDLISSRRQEMRQEIQQFLHLNLDPNLPLNIIDDQIIHRSRVNILQDPLFLEHKKNANFMLAITRLDKSLLEYADDDLKNNSNFMLKIIEIDPYLVTKAHQDLKTNAAFMLDAIKINPLAAIGVTQYTNENALIGGPDFRLDAIKSPLADNPDFVLGAMKLKVFIDPSDRLRRDSKFILKAMEIDASHALEMASFDLKNDPKITEAAEKYKALQRSLFERIVDNLPFHW